MTLQDYYRQKVGQEAFDFFAVFSRFEYALKFSALRQDNRPEASWYKMAQALGASFYEAMKAAPEAAVYFENPPRQLAGWRSGAVCAGCSAEQRLGAVSVAQTRSG